MYKNHCPQSHSHSQVVLHTFYNRIPTVLIGHNAFWNQIQHFGLPLDLGISMITGKTALCTLLSYCMHILPICYQAQEYNFIKRKCQETNLSSCCFPRRSIKLHFPITSSFSWLTRWFKETIYIILRTIHAEVHHASRLWSVTCTVNPKS